MSKKLLILAAIAAMAMLTACGSTDSSDDVVVQQETSITTTMTATETTTQTQLAVTTTPEETVTEEQTEETTAAEVTTTAAETKAKKTATTTTMQSVVYSQEVKVTTTRKKTPAEKIPATTEYKNFQAPETSLSTNNDSFPTVDIIILKASSLLGTPYGWGNKGYTGIYNLIIPNKALPVAQINQLGIDCSGLVYYTLTQLGYTSTGFMFYNPMPLDTVHWLSVNSGSVIKYGSVSSKVDVEKKGLSTAKYEYWEKADGSTITPGSVVVGENLYDDNHAWIYMGEFENRDAVIAYLKAIGVPSGLINSRTVGSGNGSGGTHWRIESNGSQGVVINNNTEKENTEKTTYSIYVFRVTQKNASFEIAMYDNDGKLAGTSLVDKSSVVYGIYRDKACTSKIGEITIGSNGKGSISLPPCTYYAKQLKSATGYIADTAVHPIQTGTNKFSQDILTRNLKVTMTSEDGIVKGGEFKLTWTRNGKAYSQTAKTNANGIAEFKGLNVYDMSTGKAISYTVTMINTDTSKYIKPADQSATLVKGNAELKVSRKSVPKAPDTSDDSSDSKNDDPAVDPGDTDPEGGDDPETEIPGDESVAENNE